MKRLLTLTTLLIMFCTCMSYAEMEKTADKKQTNGSSYLCIEDKVAGFYYKDETKSWEQTNFNPRKFIIRRPEISEKKIIEQELMPFHSSIYYAFAFGKKYPSFMCEKPGVHSIKCLNLDSQFIIDTETLKFIRTNLLGYTPEDNSLTKKYTPLISIGRCSKL